MLTAQDKEDLIKILQRDNERLERLLKYQVETIGNQATAYSIIYINANLNKNNKLLRKLIATNE
ncbi:hypothetical protein [Paratissierella segnis]|uniref:Uncharacterized protein n=1 Tax=Paratissierella segnis TaxID=2763679 RepID=A0A926ET92_9FIRM|nr:hypothetical protein [Paratissierella segnis]MBC8589368.1 hypothetical protein [Paratissierella segnis]